MLPCCLALSYENNLEPVRLRSKEKRLRARPRMQPINEAPGVLVIELQCTHRYSPRHVSHRTKHRDLCCIVMHQSRINLCEKQARCIQPTTTVRISKQASKQMATNSALGACCCLLREIVFGQRSSDRARAPRRPSAAIRRCLESVRSIRTTAARAVTTPVAPSEQFASR
jgi:hypothetical protein